MRKFLGYKGAKMKFISKITKLCASTGSTLIELIIAVMVVGLILTAVANAVTHSVKNDGEARYKQVATALGQEVIENIRSEKNKLGMVNLITILGNQTYCFQDLPGELTTTPAAGTCGTLEGIQMAGTDFFRNATVVSTGVGLATNPTDPYTLNVTVTVSWYDGANLKSVELIQRFQESY